MGVVDRYDGEAEHPLLGHGAEAHDTGRRLLVPSLHPGQQLASGGVQHGDEVRAVVDDEVRPHVQDGVEVGIVLLVALPLLGVRLQSIVLPERQRHRVIRREGIAGGQPHLGPRFLERQGQHAGLGLHVERHPDLQAFQGLLPGQSFANVRQHAHVRPRPFQPPYALLQQIVQWNTSAGIETCDISPFGEGSRTSRPSSVRDCARC